MAMTRDQISTVIDSVNAGDTVTVTWEKNGNKSTETGVVWNPSGSALWGLGPDLLDPDDTELIGIVITKRAPAGIAPPPVGSVVVFLSPASEGLHAFKRLKKGWYRAGGGGPISWTNVIKGRKDPRIFLPGTAPAKPVINTITAGVRNATVSASLGSAGTSPVNDVEYFASFQFELGVLETTGWVSTGQTTGNFVIPNLQPGVEFKVRIRSVSDTGTGAASEPKSVTPYTTPSAPYDVVATAGNAQAVLTWNEPLDDGASPITGYKIEKILASNNDGWITVIEDTASTETTYTVTGLANDELTGFRVFAINAAGVGAPSASSVGVTPTA